MDSTSMDTRAIVPENVEGWPQTDARLEARWPGQCQMIRAAQISVGGSVHDCALLDTSRGGARIHLLAAFDVPEICTLRTGGESWAVRRVWQKEMEVGFKVIGPPSCRSGAAQRPRGALQRPSRSSVRATTLTSV